jgi:hypothetical protein
MECIIDTSRNNNGPADDGTWCNYKGAGIGMNDDTHIWIKPAAELDGNCHGSPNSYQSNLGAGAFDINWLKLLWKQGYYANSGLTTPEVSTPETHEASPAPTSETSPAPTSGTSHFTQASAPLKICRVIQQ